ncbi:hypothetical protein D3C72_1344460 [compost metagenome]
MSYKHHSSPVFRSEAFTCPYCGAYAQQKWMVTMLPSDDGQKGPIGVNGHRSTSFIYGGVAYSECVICKKRALWHEEAMLVPPVSNAPPPHEDLPEHLLPDYEEARAILARSPRGAAALLRLVVQKLCVHLGEKGKNINEDIGNLVKSGLSPKIQKALDVVRVVGNNAVHPGQLDLNDTPEFAVQLFKLINVTVEEMITLPNSIDELYGELPQSQREQIEKRDEGANAGGKA